MVIPRATGGHSVIQRLWELDPDSVFGFGSLVPGINLKLAGMKKIAEKNNISLTEFRAYIGIPAWAETLIVTTVPLFAGDRDHAHNVLLLHEVFHSLQGDFFSHKSWDGKNKDLVRALEIITDFLVFMFMPLEEVSKFGDSLGYINWSNEEKRALLYRYREIPQYNPNNSLREIMQALKADIKNNTVLQIEGNDDKRVIDVLTRTKAYQDKFDTILEMLLETAHFSHYKSLFPVELFGSNDGGVGQRDNGEGHEPEDLALVSVPGGIALEPNSMDFQVEGNSGDVHFPSFDPSCVANSDQAGCDPQLLAQYKQFKNGFNGFQEIHIKMTDLPAAGLPGFLGVAQSKPKPDKLSRL